MSNLTHSYIDNNSEYTYNPFDMKNIRLKKPQNSTRR